MSQRRSKIPSRNLTLRLRSEYCTRCSSFELEIDRDSLTETARTGSQLHFRRAASQQVKAE